MFERFYPRVVNKNGLLCLVLSFVFFASQRLPREGGEPRLLRKSGGKITAFSNASRYDVVPHLRGENDGGGKANIGESR
ncbi:MAG: hypothetical protein ACOH2E_05000 [Candidatus Paracaedibacter sp.]